MHKLSAAMGMELVRVTWQKLPMILFLHPFTLPCSTCFFLLFSIKPYQGKQSASHESSLFRGFQDNDSSPAPTQFLLPVSCQTYSEAPSPLSGIGMEGGTTSQTYTPPLVLWLRGRRQTFRKKCFLASHSNPG